MRLIRLVGASAVIAAALGAFIVAGAGARGGGSAQSGLGSCKAANFTAKMALIRGSQGAGNVLYKLTLKNKGPVCVLGNHPKLKLLGKSGNQLPTHVVPVGHGGTVTLGTDKSAHSTLRFSPDVPGTGEPTNRQCEPTAHQVAVTLTSPGSGTVIGTVSPATAVCEHGGISETAL